MSLRMFYVLKDVMLPPPSATCTKGVRENFSKTVKPFVSLRIPWTYATFARRLATGFLAGWGGWWLVEVMGLWVFLMDLFEIWEQKSWGRVGTPLNKGKSIDSITKLRMAMQRKTFRSWDSHIIQTLKCCRLLFNLMWRLHPSYTVTFAWGP